MTYRKTDVKMVFVNETHPLLARRVLYIGSSVPRETATGLEAVQQPLRDRYPVNDESNIEGIDSVISVFDDSIQLKYVSDPDQVIHFPITSLTLLLYDVSQL
ncbi:hypothetical protein CHS0354_015474 [Potamilus streckersoni]|uniref:Uncharacterized protein n=1 Tax=Potamilus streckersoni TaxID=2493646 RepID=A0AAE0SEK6_9BIVA|nr:hypothetical protein CHS0354_015474 [Potamilus streckersoni]